MVSRNTSPKKSVSPSFILLIGLGIVVSFTLGFVLFLSGYSIYYSNKIFPGISVSGIDLSNLNLEEAEIKLSNQNQFQSTGKIILIDGENNWLASPEQLGYHNDYHASALQAFQYGRSSIWPIEPIQQLMLRLYPKSLPLILINDQSKAQEFLLQIAPEVHKPVQEASIQLDGVDLTVLPGEIGRDLDLESTLALIQNQLASQQDGVIPLVITETQPLLMDLTPQAETIRKIISSPLVISMPAGAGRIIGAVGNRRGRPGKNAGFQS